MVLGTINGERTLEFVRQGINDFPALKDGAPLAKSGEGVKIVIRRSEVEVRF
jgi:hypothetical protein